MTLKERAKKLKTDIPAVFIAFKDKETPVIAKIFAALTIHLAFDNLADCEEYLVDRIHIIRRNPKLWVHVTHTV